MPTIATPPQRALILVGGFGTRLRPLTLTLPKPLVPFANEPMVLHQIRALCSVGVREVILAVNYRPEIMLEATKSLELELGIKIFYSVETEPLGTAGPLALARSLLVETEQSPPFFVLNSDVICDFPFEEMLREHQSSGAEATLLVTRVSDPTKYGVAVCAEGTKRIDRFVEKPKDAFLSNRINAGVYLIEGSLLQRIEVRPTSIEKEIFPLVAKEGRLFCVELSESNYWMDVGQPMDYLAGTGLHLRYLAMSHSPALATGKGTVGNVLIDPSAVVGAGCLIGPDVVIGPGVKIADGVRLVRCTLMSGVSVRSHTLISDSIVGWNCSIGQWARLVGGCVLGEDVTVGDQLYLHGAVVLPHKGITVDVPEATIIM